MRSAGSRNSTHRDSNPDEIQNAVRQGTGDAQQRNWQDNAEKEAEGEKGNRKVQWTPAVAVEVTLKGLLTSKRGCGLCLKRPAMTT
ncbi:hypothetical protein RHSIM_Rhsim09G0084900 [Rhododendron simsii]|uniref:Uncharacterized protein n=1 Tax=Rhododendron simsii TaxID=118357 RepID=A0A834GF29_RHOSS|nr:hypothetical protein RHSIM_Rhsim09G0084900 [Rhododendron simsii]